MALSVQTLVDDARLGAWPFIREDRIAPAALLRQLTALDKEIVELYVLHDPDRLHTAPTDVTIVSGTNPTGYALSAAKAYTMFKYFNKDNIEYPLEIVREGKRPSRAPAAFIRGSTFFPIDPFFADWDGDFGDRQFFVGDGDRVEYRIVAEPAQVTAMSATLASPDEAESYIKAALTLQILLSSGEAPPERLESAKFDMVTRRALLLLEMVKRVGISARGGE